MAEGRDDQAVLWDVYIDRDGEYQQVVARGVEARIEVAQKLAHLIERYLDVLLPLHHSYYRYTPLLLGGDAASSPRILLTGYLHPALVAGIFARYPKADITVFQLSETLLDVARLQLKDYPDRIHYIKGHYLHGDFPSGMDMIFCSLMLSAVGNHVYGQTLKRFAAAMNPGGRLLISDVATTGNEEVNRYYGSLFRSWCDAYYGDDQLVARSIKDYIPGLIRVEEIQEMGRNSGFSVVNLEVRFMNSVLLFASI